MFAAITSASMEDKGHVTLTTVKFHEATENMEKDIKESLIWKANVSAAKDEPSIKVTYVVDGLCAYKNHGPLRLGMILSEESAGIGQGPRDQIENYKCDGMLRMEGMVKSDALKLEKFVLKPVNAKLTVVRNLLGRVHIIINNKARLSTSGKETQEESENVLKKMKEMKKNATITWTINKNMLNEKGVSGSLQEKIKELKKELESSQ